MEYKFIERYTGDTAPVTLLVKPESDILMLNGYKAYLEYFETVKGQEGGKRVIIDGLITDEIAGVVSFYPNVNYSKDSTDENSVQPYEAFTVGGRFDFVAYVEKDGYIISASGDLVFDTGTNTYIAYNDSLPEHQNRNRFSKINQRASFSRGAIIVNTIYPVNNA